MKSVQWLVLASSTQSYIYEIEKKEFKLVKSLSHDASRLKEVELVSDRQGQVFGRTAGQGNYERPTDSHTAEHQRFAQEIAAYLDKGRVEHLYQGLIICAEPRFYGLIENSIPKTVQCLIKKTIHKDYIPLPESQRHEVIKEILQNNH